MTKIVNTPDDIASASIGKLLADAYLAAVKALDRRLGEAGYPDVRPAHGTVFQVIRREGSRVTELAARAGMTKQAMTELVDHLEGAGYLERAPDPGDGRAKLVRLTPRGRACIAAAREIIDDLEADWSERIGRRRMAGLREGLEALGGAIAEASPPGAAEADRGRGG